MRFVVYLFRANCGTLAYCIAWLGCAVIAGTCSNVVEACDRRFGASVNPHAHSFNTRARTHLLFIEPLSFSFVCRSRQPNNKMSTHPLLISAVTSYASSSHLCHRQDSCSGLANFRSLSACIRLSFHSLNG